MMKFSIEEILRGTDCEVQGRTENFKGMCWYQSVHGEDTGQRLCSDVTSGEVEELDSSIHRRARTTITTWQRSELERQFTKHRYPTFEKVEHLSEQLGLPQYVIKVWFQNRRAKFRKETRRRSSSLKLHRTIPLTCLQSFPSAFVIPQVKPHQLASGQSDVKTRQERVVIPETEASDCLTKDMQQERRKYQEMVKCRAEWLMRNELQSIAKKQLNQEYQKRYEMATSNQGMHPTFHCHCNNCEKLQ
ncbi:homeobox protein orthopedia B-like isoform X2 [Rhopilema esculentum]|uniref:homeobox protein orthopedia B-like isoform X2 n=1 Tax=Rhopilema esculentum TaxID=499914 RepID=UPI0031D2D840